MSIVTKRISGKILSSIISIPQDMKNEELEITIRSLNTKGKRFSKLYSSPVKVSNIKTLSRESLYER